MRWLKWFVSGALAVPLGHQIVLAILNAIGFIGRPAFQMTRTEPLGVPSVISLSFWGGVWGILLGLLIGRWRGAKYWLVAVVFGAIAPTLVAGLVVAPLKGISMGRDPKLIMTGLLVNAAWGLATALFAWLVTSRSTRA